MSHACHSSPPCFSTLILQQRRLAMFVLPLLAKHSGAQHSGAQHSGARRSGAQHSGAQHLSIFMISPMTRFCDAAPGLCNASFLLQSFVLCATHSVCQVSTQTMLAHRKLPCLSWSVPATLAAALCNDLVPLSYTCGQTFYSTTMAYAPVTGSQVHQLFRPTSAMDSMSNF